MTRIGMPGAHPGAGRGGRCLGQLVTAYADRSMEASALHHWDLHLVACAACRAAVETERRVLASLRTGAAAVPADLRGMLLALAQEPAQDPEATPQGGHRFPLVRVVHQHARPHAVPPVPVAPVPVVDRGAPALHRSARRATVLAGLAAGATAAAAGGLAFAGTTGPPPTPSPTQTPVRAGWQGTPRFATAAFTVPRLGVPPSGDAAAASRPGLRTSRPGSAESTP
jgi:hypothetical protein